LNFRSWPTILQAIVRFAGLAGNMDGNRANMPFLKGMIKTQKNYIKFESILIQHL